jgi:transposase
MQTQKNCFLGIDVSKLWFDVSMIIIDGQVKQGIIGERFDNNAAGLKKFTSWLKFHKVSFDATTLVVIENTGIYHRMIWEYCNNKGLALHIGNGARIKWSLGILRGKDDVTDSQRLCDYCYRHADELQATPVLDPVILPLKDLMTARTRLKAQINSTRTYLQELKHSNSKEVQTIMEQVHRSALHGMEKSLLQIEEQIKKLVEQNAGIKNNYDLLLSVPGIGHVTAIYIICCTANFVGSITGKQLACYAGVVPFENKSGSSIKGKAKVHKMANKELKSLLHMCARSAVQHKAEFRQYYRRKEQQGKHHLEILNAVKNKILLRAVAVIKNQRKYVDNYTAAA